MTDKLQCMLGASLAGKQSTLVVAAAFLAGVTAALIFRPDGFPLDDAWIHLAYARSFLGGDGFSYNPGDWETGFSSPLWVLLLAPLSWMDDPTVPVQMLGAVLHGATAAIVTLLAQRLCVSDVLYKPLIVGLLVAISPTLAVSATSGMEVSLASLFFASTVLSLAYGGISITAILGILAVWARPEAIFFLVPLGGLVVLCPSAGDRRAGVACMAGAVLGLGLWMTYCMLLTGYPFPNTHYIKTHGGGIGGLIYVIFNVLPLEPVLLSLTGIVLACEAIGRMNRSPSLLALLMLATVVSIVAIAVSRQLDLRIGFYQNRYFFPLMWSLPLAAGLGLPAHKKRAFALLAPVLVASFYQLYVVAADHNALADDVLRLQVAPAHFIANHLPSDSKIGVEAAGAPRFFAPRSMQIIDLVGLNDREMFNVDVTIKLCRLLLRSPTHFYLPRGWGDELSMAFRLSEMMNFDDPSYVHVGPAQPGRVTVYRVDGDQPEWRAANCKTTL